MSKRIIGVYILITLLMDSLIGLHATVYVLFLRAGGLDLLQISLVNFFFMAAVFLLEIPTGAIADLYGRKRSLVISNLVFAIGFFWYSISHSFWAFVLAEIIIALGVTTTSGAFRAWVVDSLHHINWKGDLVKLFRWEGRANKLAALLGGLIGASLGVHGLNIPFRLAGVGFLLIAVLAQLIMREKYFQPSRDKIGRIIPNIKQIAKDSIQYGLKHQVVFLILVSMAVLNFSFQPINMYWALQFNDYFPTTQGLGVVWSGIVIFSLLGNELVVWF